MPVLTTIAVISYLSKDSDNKVSFFNPAAFRAKLEDLPKGPARSKALALADKLDRLAREHDYATELTVRAYAADLDKYSATADQLGDLIEPLDRVRARVYQEAIDVRQALINILSPEEWEQVFG